MSSESSEGKSEQIKDAWYSYDGPENDIIISSRMRFARNLASFPFPSQLKTFDEGIRIQSLVFDTFSQMENPDFYQALNISNLDKMGQEILTERGVLASKKEKSPWIGVVVRLDGKIFCTINSIDHVRLSAFTAGLDFSTIYNEIQHIDNKMQDFLQFAASVEFGYLTSLQRDLGSGMKISAALHLPAISKTGLTGRFFSEIIHDRCEIIPFFESGLDVEDAIGSYYLVSNSDSFYGNELEQYKRLEEVVLHLATIERGATMNLCETRPTKLKDTILRAIALVKFSRYIEYKEGIDLISKIKWGVTAGFVKGITHTTLTELLFRTQNAHLAFVIKTGNLNFPTDITREDEKILRLRTLILQESLASLEFTE